MNINIQLGLQALQTGRIEHAKQAFKEVLSVDPKNADAMHWLGVIAFQHGQRIVGLQKVEEVLLLQPNNAQFNVSKGNMLKQMGRFDEAISSYERAIKLKPDAADALNNLGVLLAQKLRHSEAIASFEKAILIAPGYFDAYNNLGVSLKVMGSLPEAYEAFWKAVQLNPNYPQAIFNLAVATEPSDRSKAIELAERAVRLVPSYQLAWVTLSKWHMEQGNIDSAKQASSSAQQLGALPGLKVFDSLALPAIMGTVDEIETSRESFARNLEKLFAQGVLLEDPFMEHCTTNFFLAYHGLNDRSLQEQTAKFYLSACPHLAYTAPHCHQPRKDGKRLRVGLLSPYITSHAVAASSAGLINGLVDDDGIDVRVITTRVASHSAIIETYPKLRESVVVLPPGLAGSRQSIASMELDILVYLDIGMEPKTYFLAFSRLARVQCVLGGHPVTTGIPNLDYYLSTDAIEPMDAQEHYSEQLIRLPHGPFYFSRPSIPVFNKTRVELGLPEEGNLYLCPMTLFKIHPDFDTVVNAILMKDQNGVVIFFKDRSHPHYHEVLQLRHDRTISTVNKSRVVFIPWISDQADFMRVIEASDVVLDPFHFGMGTTAIQVCSVGTPFITLPGKYMRSRVGLYWSRLLTMESELVASSFEDYVEKAVAIANNPSLRTRVKSKIMDYNFNIFENSKGIGDVIDFLRSCPLQVTID